MTFPLEEGWVPLAWHAMDQPHLGKGCHLALRSPGITPGNAWGTPWDAENCTRLGCVQGKLPPPSPRDLKRFKPQFPLLEKGADPPALVDAQGAPDVKKKMRPEKRPRDQHHHPEREPSLHSGERGSREDLALGCRQKWKKEVGFKA